MKKSSDLTNHRASGRSSHFRDYMPLVVIATASIATGFAQSESARSGGASWILGAMGFFLVILSLLKFFDLPGFADGFQLYDLLGRKIRIYAYIYPFLEFFLGLGYVARFRLPIVFAVTVALMAFGALGVIRSLTKGLDVECACMGTALHVPLSTVTLTEDLGMAIMAAAMWAAAPR